MKRAVAFIILALGAASAGARGPNGALDVIVTPNNGVPVIVAPGEPFDALLTERASLRLTSEGAARALDVEWTDGLPGGFVRARCSVAKTAAPGAYSLEADADGRKDVNVRAVYVRKEFPKTYTFAHLTDTHVGSDRHPRASEDIMTAVIDAINEAEPAFVLITGDVTENGEMDHFRSLLGLMDACTVPTFVCPGNHDRQSDHYERVFGPRAYAFRFGLDGYLAFDTKDYRIADDLDTQIADLQLLRREIKSVRWSIGFTHRFAMDMGMRTQLILFVDDPLDHILFGHYHRANKKDEDEVPWGDTGLTMTPAGIDGAMRFMQVSPRGVEAGPVQRPARTR
ncbi:MAG: hypothetical protein GY851_07780 [bacterium]|nr:hypothetical protein [bacterium]